MKNVQSVSLRGRWRKKRIEENGKSQRDCGGFYILSVASGRRLVRDYRDPGTVWHSGLWWRRYIRSQLASASYENVRSRDFSAGHYQSSFSDEPGLDFYEEE
jgi:hypothetical protein